MISVILNVYKRPHMLEKQIEAIKNQGSDPSFFNMDEKMNMVDF